MGEPVGHQETEDTQPLLGCAEEPARASRRARMGLVLGPVAAGAVWFLVLGGFGLALAMQRWGLHRRIALLTIRLVGTRPTRLVGGFMLAAAGLSMWVSNTATTVMMLPIGVSVLGLVTVKLGPDDCGQPPEGPLAERAGDQAPTSAEEIAESPAPNLGTGLMLGIAYAASIGSLATRARTLLRSSAAR